MDCLDAGGEGLLDRHPGLGLPGRREFRARHAAGGSGGGPHRRGPVAGLPQLPFQRRRVGRRFRAGPDRREGNASSGPRERGEARRAPASDRLC